MRVMKIDQPDRYLKLEHLCQRPVFVTSDAYEMGTSKQQKRQEIAQLLSTEISVVPPSRLLSLIGQALRFQQAQGLIPKDGTMDLFRGGRRSARKDQEEKPPTRQGGHIKFNPDSHPETTLFSPDGLSLVTGSVDGFLEVWDSDTCRLRKDLEYQAKDELMMHEEQPILCGAFNRDGELLATGSGDGKVKVWKLSTGVCLRKFNRAHSQGVTCVCFARDSTQILTGSFDALARIHGLKSGKTLKEFRYPPQPPLPHRHPSHN
jgi:WD40 repeat-containing protein SMU1